MKSSCTRPWPVLIMCCILTFNAMGLVFGMGAIFTDIMDTYHVPRATASLVQSLCLGVSLGFGLVAGNFIEWQGPRVTVITGSAVATAGYVIAFLATHIAQVIVGIGIIAGIGLSFVYVAGQIVTGVVFYDMKSLALALFSICTAGGSVFFPLVLRHVTDHYSLRGTFLIMAAIICQMALCGALIGHFTPRTTGKTSLTIKPRKEADAADETADVAAGVTEGEDGHGNPRKSRDADAGCRCSAEGTCDGERLGFLARDHDAAAAADVVLTNNIRESEVHQDDHLADNSEQSMLDTHLDLHHNVQTDLELPKEERVRLVSETGENAAQNPRNSVSSINNSLGGGRNLENARSFELTSLKTDEDVDSKRCQADKPRSALHVQLEVLCNVRFVIFAAVGLSAFLFFTQPMMFMTDMVTSQNMTVEDGSFFLTVMFVGSVTGRVAAGLLHRCLKSRFILLVNSFAVAGGGVTCLCYSLTTQYAHFVAVSLIHGVCYGLFSGSIPVTTLEILGPGRFGVGTGYVCTAAGVFVLLAGPYGGTIRDLTKSYIPLYYIAIVHGLIVWSLQLFTALRCRHRS